MPRWKPEAQELIGSYSDLMAILGTELPVEKLEEYCQSGEVSKMTQNTLRKIIKIRKEGTHDTDQTFR